MNKNQSISNSSYESSKIRKIKQKKFKLKVSPEEDLIIKEEKINRFEKSNTNPVNLENDYFKPVVLKSDSKQKIQEYNYPEINKQSIYKKDPQVETSKKFNSFDITLKQPIDQKIQNHFGISKSELLNLNQMKENENFNLLKEPGLGKRNNFNFMEFKPPNKKFNLNSFGSFSKFKPFENNDSHYCFSRELHHDNKFDKKYYHSNIPHYHKMNNFDHSLINSNFENISENEFNHQFNPHFQHPKKLGAFTFQPENDLQEIPKKRQNLNPYLKSIHERPEISPNIGSFFTSLKNNKLPKDNTVKEKKESNEENFSYWNKNSKNGFNNLSYDSSFNKYLWQYESDLNEKEKLENLLSKMITEKKNLTKQIFVIMRHIDLLQTRVQRFVQTYEKPNENQNSIFKSKSDEFSNLTVNLMISFGSESTKIDLENTLSQDNSPLNNQEGKINQLAPHRNNTQINDDNMNFIDDHDDYIREKKNESVNEKSSQKTPLPIKYILGKESDYILVKFNKEKKRDKFKYVVPIENVFPELQNICLKILWCEHISQEELDSLSIDYKEIIKNFLCKKKMLQINDELDFKEEKFNQICQNNGIKRNEENLKCVFKYALKFLRAEFRKKHSEFKFRKQNANMKHKNLVDLGFYTFYFGKIADEYGYPISKFFHPKVFSGNETLNENIDEPDQRPKTINKEYIDNLKKSPQFMQDLQDYLNDTFIKSNNEMSGIINEYKEISKEKLYQKLDKWYRKFKVKGWKIACSDIIKELKKNDKCKLPWSVKEMEKAVQDTKNHFGIQDNDLT